MLPAGVTKHIYNGNGSTRDWAFTFPIFSTDGSDIKLYKTSIAGVVTEITSNYNVNVAGGFVTYPTIVSGLARLVTGEKITLLREEALAQEVDWRNKGPFNAEVVEAVADKIVAILQQHDELFARTIKFSVDQIITEAEMSTFLVNMVNLGEIADAEAAKAGAEIAQAGAEAAQAAAEIAAASVEFKTEVTVGDGSVVGNVVYISAENTVQSANATDNTKPVVGVLIDTDKMQIMGRVVDVITVGSADIVAGDLVYLSSTAGKITKTPPATAGNIVQLIGRAITNEVTAKVTVLLNINYSPLEV